MKTLFFTLFVFTFVNCSTNCTFIYYDEKTKSNVTATQHCVVGHCVADRCVCEDRYFGDDCSLTPVNYIVYGIAACDTIVLCFAIYKSIQFKKVTKKFTMKFITLAFILFGLLTRTVWQWEVAARLEDVTKHIWFYPDTILYSLFYPCIICAYTIELFMWIELLVAHSAYEPIFELPKTRRVFFWIMGVVFVMEIINHSISASISSLAIILYIAWLCYIGLILIVEICITLTIGYQLLKKIKGMQLTISRESTRAKIKAISLMLMATTGVLILLLILAICGIFDMPPIAGASIGWTARLVELFVPILILIEVRPPVKKGESFSSDTNLSVTQYPQKE